MFKSSYKFNKVNHRSLKANEYDYIEHVYTFRNKDSKRYVVFVEQYDYNVYAVKFCTHERKNYSDRFTILSKYNECSKVLTTIGAIMLSIVNTNPYASFGFIGSPLPKEQKSNTKRFRLYAKVVEHVISPTLFEHRKSADNSSYLMLNRDNLEQKNDLLDCIQTMMYDLYLLE